VALVLRALVLGDVDEDGAILWRVPLRPGHGDALQSDIAKATTLGQKVQLAHLLGVSAQHALVMPMELIGIVWGHKVGSFHIPVDSFNESPGGGRMAM
jgi:hypothetical protein